MSTKEITTRLETAKAYEEAQFTMAATAARQQLVVDWLDSLTTDPTVPSTLRAQASLVRTALDEVVSVQT